MATATLETTRAQVPCPPALTRRKGTYRQERFEARIRHILQCAARIFRRKGYHGTRMEEIAAELRMTKANLYYYFRNKEDILYTCHLRSLEIGLEALRLARRSKTPADDRLRLLLRHYMLGLMDELRGSVVLLEEGALSPALRKKIIEKRDLYERGLRQIIDEGVQEGRFAPCDPKVQTFIILGAVNWIPKWYSPDGPLAPETIAGAFTHSLVRGLLRSSRR